MAIFHLIAQKPPIEVFPPNFEQLYEVVDVT